MAVTSAQKYQFETGVYRPPSEGGSASLLMRFTRNCPWNNCTFCGMYKVEKFQVRPVEEIKRDIRERMDWENFAGILGWDKIFVSSVVSTANRDCEGRTIPQIAEARGLADPADAACDLLIEEKLAVGIISFGLSEEDVVTIMHHPSVSFITDSLLGGGKPHPRTYGTYPRILGSYVREQQVLRLEEAIRKMTSLPAQNLRLRTKGVLAAGYDADLVVFDPATIAETATYEEPRQYPEGIGWVLVNGIPVVAEGSHTGERPGRAVRTR